MRSLFLFLSFLLFSNLVSAQVLEPVKWDISYEHLSGDEYMLVYSAQMDDPWVVYSQYTSDTGPVPTEITYESAGFEKIGQSTETGHKKEGFDKMFETEVIKFLSDQPYVIKQKISAKAGTEVSGYLTYMTCNNERCLPPTDVDFSLKLVGGKTATAPAQRSQPTSVDAVADEARSRVETAVEKTTTTITDAATKIGTVSTGAASAVEKAAGQITKAANDAGAEVSKAIDQVSDKVAEAANKVEGKIKTTGTGGTKNISVVSSTGGINVSGDNITMGQISISDQGGNSQPAGGVLSPVTWDVTMKSLGNNNEYEIKYTATAESPWTVYSQFTSDDGPVPTEITYETKGVEQLGKGTELGHKKQGPDKLFDNVEVIKFLSDEPFVITHRIKSSVDKMKGYLTYMTCDNERCLPPTDVEFAFDLKSGQRLDYDNLQSAAAAPITGSALVSSLGANIVGNKLDNKIPQLSASYKQPIGNCSGGGSEDNKRSLLSTFIFGFLGGLIALLTPCVFPMIPLTVSFFTKDTKRKGWVNGLIYGLSIIVIYVALGIGLTAFFGEEALNRLSVNWIANTAFFLIFIFFAFSFFGYYEIRLPSSWSTKSDTMADKGGLLGIFFMAFTLALVSFSCTGPIIGSAIVSAASSGSKLGPAIVMGGFALGLALPFGVFAAVPALLNSLPRSGGWMNSVKVVLGFLELALAFKFLSVADLTNHWGFLRYELFMAIWVLCFAGMTAYLFGKIKFPHDSPVTKLSPMRKILAFASLAFTLYLMTGFIPNKVTNSYNSKAAMSGLAPPSSYNYFLSVPEVDKSIKAQYPSYTMCANSIPCFKDYYEGKAFAAAAGKPVFLDFTGHGCVNCRKTEELIWVDDEVRNRLVEDWVLVSLYVDDDKKLDNVYVSKERKNKIRNVGNMWADFQILNFDQNSQPLYVMMTPGQEVLAKPRGFKTGIESYLEYMDCGMDTYNKLNN